MSKKQKDSNPLSDFVAVVVLLFAAALGFWKGLEDGWGPPPGDRRG